MTALMVVTELDSLSHLDGATLSQAIGILKEMHAKHGSAATIALDIDWDKYEDYHTPKLTINGFREETEWETGERERREKEVLDGELAQLAYLKAKYEPK